MKTSFDAHHPATPLAFPPSPARDNQTINESYRAQTQNADITLTTSEGDRITISQSTMSQQQRAVYSTDSSQRLLEQSMTASGMSFTVQGDLNDQELTDLTALLGDLSGIAADFFNGNLEEAVSGAMDIGDMGSISTLEATFSQTSLLANYLRVPHPLPTFSGQQSEPEAPSSLDTLPPPSPGQNMVDLLTGQWQQFLDALTSQEDSRPSTSPPEHHRHHKQSEPVINSAEHTGKNMVERSKETMNTHPRLTPLMPSLAGLAISQIARQYNQNDSAGLMSKDLGAAFNRAFNDWLL